MVLFFSVCIGSDSSWLISENIGIKWPSIGFLPGGRMWWPKHHSEVYSGR